MENQRTADPAFYEKLDYLMFAIEIASFSFDALAERAVRKRAKEVLDHKLNNGGWPSVLDDETKKAKEVIEKLAIYNEIITKAIDNLPATVKTKVSLFNKDKQIAFLSDFADNNSLLNQLNNTNNAYYFDNWENLYAINCVDRKQIDFISKTVLTDCLMRYYSDIGLRKVLEPLSLELRINFLKKYGTVNNLSATRFDKLKEDPGKLELLLNDLNGTKLGQPDNFTTAQVFNIIDSNLEGRHVDLLAVKSKYSLKELGKRFGRQIKYNTISKQRLNDLYNCDGEIFPFFIDLSKTKKDDFQSANKLLIEIQPYNGNVPVGSMITEKYMSGKNSTVTGVISNPSSKGFIEPSNQANYGLFKTKAIDMDETNRYNDTELKFIFNFLEQHWDKGDRFVINMESLIDVCSSCQGYITSLQELAKQNGKIIEFNITAHPKAKSIPILKDILNQQ